MKLKITSIHLVLVVIVQIIFIDAFLAAFLFKQSTALKSASPEVSPVSAKNAGIAFPFEKEYAMRDSWFGDAREAYFAAVEEKWDSLRGYIAKTKLSDTNLKIFKIPDIDANKIEFIATAYDLSYQSCGKYPSHPAYGITFSGKKAVKGRTIAVDPNVIPIGSVVYIKFPGEYTNLDGIYTAEDTGSKIIGQMVDVFFGESAFLEIEKFGSRRVHVDVIEEGKDEKMHEKGNNL